VIDQKDFYAFMQLFVMSEAYKLGMIEKPAYSDYVYRVAKEFEKYGKSVIENCEKTVKSGD
jgi:hypothetical protein